MAHPFPIRIGVIGAGGNTKLKHIPGFQAIDGVSVDVICNRTEASSRKAADECGASRVATHWKEMVADPNIDAVCIGTWPYLHAEASIAALEAGKHVLTEARMAMDAAEAERMLAAARKRPELVAQIVPSPFTLPWDATISETLASGEIGVLREIALYKTLPGNADANAPLNWRQDRGYSGNNTLMLGIYYEVVHRWLRRQPERVWASGEIFTKERFDASGKSRAIEIPETITFHAAYADGLRLSGYMTGLAWGMNRDEYLIHGCDGSLRLDLVSGKLYKTIRGGAEAEVVVPSENRGAWNVESDFIASIRDGAPVRLTRFEDGLAYMRFTDAALESYRAGGAWTAL